MHVCTNHIYYNILKSLKSFRGKKENTRAFVHENDTSMQKSENASQCRIALRFRLKKKQKWKRAINS